MTYTNKFLDIDLTTHKDVIIDSFIKAIVEIRSEELNIPIDFLEKNGDSEAVALIKKSSIQDICLHTHNVKLVDDVPFHAQQLIKQYEENQAVTVFRGTRLPLANSSFKNDYMHTTPQFATSTAYAVGISNSVGGIGRLLTKEGQRTGLGFIHTYEAPLTTKVYKNFQFERILKNMSEDTYVTLNDLKQELENFAILDKSSFEVEYFSEKNLYGNPNQKIKMSENMAKWYDFITSTKCLETPYYEVMLPEKTTKKYTFLINENAEIIKLDLNNPKIKKILKKLQNLLMRDFYEIVPLDKLISDIEFNISDIQSKENNHNKFQKELFSLVKKETLLLKELKKSVEDMIEKCKKQTLLSDHDIEQCMNQSQMVGSTNMLGEPTIESKITYHCEIEKFMTNIKNKKRLIELPLENFLALENLTSEKIVLKLKNNDTSPINVVDVNIVDKLIAKIKEKDIHYHLNIKNLDKGLVMLECMKNIEKN